MSLRRVLTFAALCALGITGRTLGSPVPEPPPANAGAATPADQAASGETPQIKFDATEVNLGDVIRGNDAVATFTYRNTGTAPLHILSAKPG